ncbi:MAG: 16S rRNA (guanine(527)-N(7))-methyltransferase RsmG [Rickettsiales bacterium]
MIGNATSSPSSQNVSRETFLPLAEYVALLLKWNSKINLIGPATESDIWTRHIEDSLQLMPLIPASAKTLVDFGSGAGLPGMVIAIARPDLQITLVEQDQRKAAFLMEAKRVLQLSNVTVEATDIAKLTATYNIVTARALSSLTNLLTMATPCMEPDSVCIFPKGENFIAELTVAKQQWHFDTDIKTSKTNAESAVLLVTNVTSHP